MDTKSELEVILEAKECCRYIFFVTSKIAKNYRLYFIDEMQKLAISIIKCLYKANDVNLLKTNKNDNLQLRLKYQQQALYELKLLSFLSLLALENQCILLIQYKTIATNVTKTQNKVQAWIRSDAVRYGI